MNTQPKQDNTAKTMNAAQRLERATIIARAYRVLMDSDIATGNYIGEFLWKAEYRAAYNIARNMHTMRDIPFNPYSIIK